MTLNRSISAESVPFLMKLILEKADRSQNLLKRTTKKQDPRDDLANEDCHHKQSAIGSDGEDDSLETVISTEFGTYLTLKHLESKVLDELDRVGGRITVSDLNRLLGVEEPGAIEACLVRLGTFQAKDQVMTDSYTTRKVIEISSVLNYSRGGSVSVTDLASEWDLPAEAVLQILLQPGHLPSTVHLLTQENGSKSLVSDAFLRHLQSSFHGVLLGTSAPTNIRLLCRDRQWDPTWVVQLILPRLLDVIPGDVHGDCYVPHIHTKQQTQAVEAFFSANGFITSDHGHKLGVLPSTLKQYVLKAFPAALALNDWLVDRDRLIPPLEALVQEALDSGSWVDLTLQLPPELLADESTCRTLLLDYVLSNDGSDGVVAITCDTALFMSDSMVQSIMKDTVWPMIEPWSKRRALEMLKSEGDESTLSSATRHAAKKSKRSAKKTLPLSPSNEYTDDHPSVLPLDDIVNAVVTARNGLTELRSETTEKDCALVQLCEKAFHSNDLLISTCKRDLEAEVLRLEKERAARISISRRETAAKERNIQASFEDPSCFATLCYLIQGFSTFIEYASSADGQVVTLQETKDLKRDFLLGCGAEFTRRVSLFCLFKNDADNHFFSFEQTEALSAELSHFCSPVPVVCRTFPMVYVSCRKEDDPKDQGPLAKLRSILPATVGTALARQWVLCGAESYQCGTKPGDYEGFLKHIEEHCLTICGLPFKSFDKKAKKQFLNARRLQLVQALECETDPAACLDLAVMLLFQLVKNHVVFGSLLNGPILRLLCHEKKISEDVSQALLHASGQAAAGETIDKDAIDRLKRLALGWK